MMYNFMNTHLFPLHRDIRKFFEEIEEITKNSVNLNPRGRARTLLAGSRVVNPIENARRILHQDMWDNA